MTRVAPKDGRGHQSHKIYSYMFRHAESICKQVSHLKERGVINRRETPSILVRKLIFCLGYVNVIAKYESLCEPLYYMISTSSKKHPIADEHWYQFR